MKTLARNIRKSLRPMERYDKYVDELRAGREGASGHVLTAVFCFGFAFLIANDQGLLKSTPDSANLGVWAFIALFLIFGLLCLNFARHVRDGKEERDNRRISDLEEEVRMLRARRDNQPPSM